VINLGLPWTFRYHVEVFRDYDKNPLLWKHFLLD